MNRPLDDLPGDRCGTAVRLLLMLRERGRQMGVQSRAFTIAAHDLAECGFVRVFVTDETTHMQLIEDK